MKLIEAVVMAAKSSRMVYQESKRWHHRGILTDFNMQDFRADDWQVVGVGPIYCPDKDTTEAA